MGGPMDSTAPEIRVTPSAHLRQGPISPDAASRVVASWATDGGIGGVASFLGLVRADETPAGIVQAIEFTAHEEMAERTLRELCERLAADAVRDRPGPVRLHVEHALGTLAVGEIPVIVVAGTGHRVEAFGLCRAVIEALKSDVPIFGREVTSNGHRWKTNR